MKLTKLAVRFMGPHSALLFKCLYVQSEWRGFEEVFIGAGESKAIAAARALSLVRGGGFGPVFENIESELSCQLPSQAATIEGDLNCSIYCILAISTE